MAGGQAGSSSAVAAIDPDDVEQRAVFSRREVSRPTWLLKQLLDVAAVAAAFSTSAVLAQDAFHLTFGTTGNPESHYADGVGFVVETDSGDVVVAGAGASFFSDDRDGLTYPLIARVRTDGGLRWQRVYSELENQRVMALLAVGEEQFMVLRTNPRLRTLEGPATGVSLRRIGESGDVSQSLGTLEGFSVLEPFPVKGVEPYFLIVAARHPAAPGPFLDVRLFRLDLRGNVTELASVAGVGSLEGLAYPGGEELLVTRWRSGESAGDGRSIAIHTDVTRVRWTGETEVAFTIANKLCRSVAASLASIFCIEYEWPGTEEASDVLVSYSPTGQVSWRHDLEPGVRIRLMRPLDSGGLVYSYVDGTDAIIACLSAAGALLWTQRLRSTGPYAFLGGIEQLRNDRLALFGSTGSFGALVSTDTDAMLIVTDVSDGDLSPEIISTVIDSGDAGQ